MPRNNRPAPSSDINASLTYERTLGSLGGIRAEGSAEVSLEGALNLNNRLSGGVDFAERTANLNTEIGLGRKLNGSLEASVKLRENGSIESLGGGIGGSILGFGGGISADTGGNAAISAEAFGGKVEVARDASGAVTVQVCYGVGIAEFCTTFSRDNGDPQNEGTLKLDIGIKPGTGSARPQKPKAPAKTSERPKPRARRERDKPERPKPERPVKPTEDKQPNLVRRVDKKPPVDIRNKPPIDLRKKPPIDLRKKPPIDLTKPKADIRKKPAKPPKSPKPAPPSRPINLKKPVPTPKPKPTPLPRPKGTPKTPKTPRPTPTPPSKPVPVPRPNPWPREPPSPNNPGITYPSDDALKLLSPKSCYDCVILNRVKSSGLFTFVNPLTLIRASVPSDNHGDGVWSSHGNRVDTANYEYTSVLSPVKLIEHTPADNAFDGMGGGFKVDYKDFGNIDNTNHMHLVNPDRKGFVYFELQPPGSAGRVIDTGENIAYRINNYRPPNNVWEISLIEIPCEGNSVPGLPRKVTPKNLNPPKFKPPRLPNSPTKIKPMDCCKKVDEIYKYLGIAKLKKNKFPVAKAFMVPGGTGNEECEDYYQLNQALFRMLANGLIINPTSKPLGSEWKSVNATAWAGQVYEMVAEAMSNGDSTQKYEISMMMQVTQLLTILAEQTRKIEFLSEVIGIDPYFDTEEIPACFTIYEGHKGFGEKQPKKIDTTKAKTDTEVEEVLAKMLKPSKIPITKWVLKPESKSIVQILREG